MTKPTKLKFSNQKYNCNYNFFLVIYINNK